MTGLDSRFTVGVVVTLLTGGGYTFLAGLIQARKAPSSTSRDGGRAADQVDASILAIGRARDELEHENERLRKNAERDRAAWEAREARYLAEIDRLAALLENVRTQLNTLREQIRKERMEENHGDT